MKAILSVCFSLAALLVVVLFFFWGARAHEQAAASTRAAEAAEKERSAAAAPEATSLTAAPASTSADPARETAVPPGTLDDTGARSELPPMTDFASALPPLSLDEVRAVEYQRFEKKYDTVSAPARKIARDAIDQYVRAHKSGAEDNGRRVSEDEITALFHELEWLDAHPSP
jgi:hypothetical protein